MLLPRKYLQNNISMYTLKTFSSDVSFLEKVFAKQNTEFWHQKRAPQVICTPIRHVSTLIERIVHQRQTYHAVCCRHYPQGRSKFLALNVRICFTMTKIILIRESFLNKFPATFYRGRERIAECLRQNLNSLSVRVVEI